LRLVGDGWRQETPDKTGGQHEESAEGALPRELKRLRSLARDGAGTLGFVIANLGFAAAEVAALGPHLAAAGEDGEADSSERAARLRRALTAIDDALREARASAERLRQLHRELLEGDPTDIHPGVDPVESGSRRAAIPGQAQRSRVMVIDDEPMIVRAIQRLLEGEHEVVMCTDPSDAIGLLRAGDRFQAILCDLMMPAMSGIDVYQEVRQLDADQAERMVFMTGGAFTPRVVEFLSVVSNAKIDKPLERSALREAIRRTVNS